MGSKSIIKELFEVFFIERAKEKGHLYRAAVYFALALTLFSTFIQVILNPGNGAGFSRKWGILNPAFSRKWRGKGMSVLKLPFPF